MPLKTNPDVAGDPAVLFEGGPVQPEAAIALGWRKADAPESDSDAATIAITSKTVVKGEALTFTAVRDGGWNAVLKRKR